jgi:hypothetical protein
MSDRHPAFASHYPRPALGRNPHEITDDERAHVLDRLQAGALPKAGIVRKLMRLYDAQRRRITELEGDVSAAHQDHANAVNAKQQRIAELETQLVTRDARIAEAATILSTPGTWSEFAAKARKALTDG